MRRARLALYWLAWRVLDPLEAALTRLLRFLTLKR
jgi:hypothetical protein